MVGEQGGHTIAPLTDSDPNVICVGMGEIAICRDVSHGHGVYKSADNPMVRDAAIPAIGPKTAV